MFVCVSELVYTRLLEVKLSSNVSHKTRQSFNATVEGTGTGYETNTNRIFYQEKNHPENMQSSAIEMNAEAKRLGNRAANDELAHKRKKTKNNSDETHKNAIHWSEKKIITEQMRNELI